MITTTVEGGKRLESEHTTLSGLLESALTDLEIVIRSETCVDMGTWVSLEYGAGNGCAACLAGAVILNGIGDQLVRDGYRSAEPARLAQDGLCSYKAADHLLALNEARQGDLIRAYDRMFGRYLGFNDREYQALLKVEEMFRNASWLERTEWSRQVVMGDDTAGNEPGPAVRFFRDRIVPALKTAGL